MKKKKSLSIWWPWRGGGNIWLPSSAPRDGTNNQWPAKCQLTIIHGLLILQQRLTWRILSLKGWLIKSLVLRIVGGDEKIYSTHLGIFFELAVHNDGTTSTVILKTPTLYQIYGLIFFLAPRFWPRAPSYPMMVNLSRPSGEIQASPLTGRLDCRMGLYWQWRWY